MKLKIQKDIQTHMNTNIQKALEKKNHLMNIGMMTFLTGYLGFNSKAAFFIKILRMFLQKGFTKGQLSAF